MSLPDVSAGEGAGAGAAVVSGAGSDPPQPIKRQAVVQVIVQWMNFLLRMLINDFERVLALPVDHSPTWTGTLSELADESKTGTKACSYAGFEKVKFEVHKSFSCISKG